MRIRTITCHHVYNHGAYLQAHALVTYLQTTGHDAKIINYRPDYLRGHFNLWHIEQKYKKIGLGWLYLLAKLPKRLIALKRKKVFDKFYEKYIQTTTEEYHSIDELKVNPPVADCYIAGSDQIWNTTFKNGTDAGFYLDFGNKSTKRISYAASFATERLFNGTESYVKEKLYNFDKISVRESSGLRILNNLGFDGEQVADPVFLLPQEYWNKFASNDGFKESYILIYDFDNSPEIKKIAKQLAKLQNIKIYSIGSSKLKYANRNYINFDPTTFVGLIKNAKYVISNSFHGTAFALIFKKDFFVINRADGLNERMKDLLTKYNLLSRLISIDTTNNALLRPIDYSLVCPLIDKDTIKSKEFLYNSLK